MNDKKTVNDVHRSHRSHRSRHLNISESKAMRRHPYAVVVMKYGSVVGHLQQKCLRVSFLFIQRGGMIFCQVLGRNTSVKKIISLKFHCTLS